MYKSKVLMITGENVYRELVEYFKENWIGPDDDIKTGNFHLIAFDWCDWTNSHKEVREIMAILESFKIPKAPKTLLSQRNDPNEAFSYLRIGEEPGDVEIITNKAGKNCITTQQTQTALEEEVD